MKLIDRYISRRVISFFFTFLVSILLLIVLFDYIINHAKYTNLTFISIIYFYTLNSITLLKFVLPIAICLSIYFTAQHFSTNNEFLAFISIGGSYMRIVHPFFFYAIFFIKIMFIIECFVVPNVNNEIEHFKQRNNLKNNILNIKDDISSDLFFKLNDNSTLYIGNYNCTKNIGSNVWIDKFKNDTKVKSSSFIIADEIKWNKEKREWYFPNMKEYILNDTNDKIAMSTNTVYKIDKNLTPDMLSVKCELAKKLTITKLLKYIKKLNNITSHYVKDFQLVHAEMITNVLMLFIVILLAVFLFFDIKRRFNNHNQHQGFTVLIPFIFMFFCWVMPSKLINVYVSAFLPLLCGCVYLLFLYYKRSCI